MRAFLDKLEQFAVDVINGQRLGKRAGIFRFFLWLLSMLYDKIVRVRLWLYQENLCRQRTVGCQVVSIGNLTVGGTGKTPVVELFARTLQARGRNVAVLSRGYKSKPPPFLKRFWRKLLLDSIVIPPRVVSDGHSLQLDSIRAGDEPFMLGSNLTGVKVLVDKDRVKSAMYAIEKWGVDTLVLDDGFQYLPLTQRLDVVLIDSQSPFGNGHLLPRGFLREPTEHLKRADLIFLTKCDSAGNEGLKAVVRKRNAHAPIVECKHEPLYCQNVITDERRPLDFLDDMRIASVSAIAAPDSFEGFLRTLGGNLIYAKQFADHHRFSREEIEKVMTRAKKLRAKAVITTEKDAVRFPTFAEEELPLPVYFLRVEIKILSGQETFEACIQKIAGQRNGRNLSS